MSANCGDSKDTADFVRLFTEIARELYAYILVLLPDEDAADDVFQEVSAILWERFEQYQPGTNFYAWAKQIAYYKVLHYRESNARRTVYLGEKVLELLAEEVAQAEETLAEQFRALSECLRKLPGLDRDLIESRYTANATTVQVAADSKRSVHQVYRALRRIHRTLFDCITKTLRGRVR